MSKTNIYETRASYSQVRLDELRNRINDLDEVSDLPNLTIFSVGSYARLEASKYSDIDMFFLCDGNKDKILEPRTNSLRLFGKMIETIKTMGFPKFSNDCQYLTILHTEDILIHLGSPRDDHENYFTVRMLLLLESHCLYGNDTFQKITADIVKSYFKDYPDHKETFQPMFLLNDICRFWKTLLLNYENKRNGSKNIDDPENIKTRQRVRNFKLKHSRMTTCFATIVALGCYQVPVTEKDVIELTKLTPHERLELIKEMMPAVTREVNEVLDGYAWFLEITGSPTEELEAHFCDNTKRTEMFNKANEYGDSMFKLLQAIDATDKKLGLLRYLVI